MDDKTINIEELLLRILERKASKEEIRYFSEWIRVEENWILYEKFKKLWNLSAGSHANKEMLETGVKEYRSFMENSLKPRRNIGVFKKISSVAAVLLMVLSSILWMRKDVVVDSLNQKQEECPVAGVILKLANNKEINVLSDSLYLSGEVGEIVTINKTDLREIAYEVRDSVVTEEGKLSYNQIIVPAGERFSVRLSDGTKVWINSESSLRYPAYFAKSIREVEARGNVYFEVAKDSTRPFVVVSRELKTEVLGTRFEVNTYGDRDEVSATLVEGSVRVNVGSRFVVMKPNQQFVFNTKNGGIDVAEVDAARKVMWKDGILVIDNESFRDVIWKLERWYGVSIVNETGFVFTQSFSGEFDREDIQAAIETMCVNLNITYMMDKDRIILKR
jgi:transmembrane sensor